MNEENVYTIQEVVNKNFKNVYDIDIDLTKESSKIADNFSDAFIILDSIPNKDEYNVTLTLTFSGCFAAGPISEEGQELFLRRNMKNLSLENTENIENTSDLWPIFIIQIKDMNNIVVDKRRIREFEEQTVTCENSGQRYDYYKSCDESRLIQVSYDLGMFRSLFDYFRIKFSLQLFFSIPVLSFTVGLKYGSLDYPPNCLLSNSDNFIINSLKNNLNISVQLSINAKLRCSGNNLDILLCNNLEPCKDQKTCDALREKYEDHCFNETNISDGCVKFFEEYYNVVGPLSRIDEKMVNYCSAKNDYVSLFPSGNDAEICGCHLPDAFYDNFEENVSKYFYFNPEVFGEKKYCLFPFCVTSKIPNESIGKGGCKNPICIEILDFNNDGSFSRTDIIIAQGNKCNFNEKKQETPQSNFLRALKIFENLDSFNIKIIVVVFVLIVVSVTLYLILFLRKIFQRSKRRVR
jgi:hypothetical protein